MMHNVILEMHRNYGILLRKLVRYPTVLTIMTAGAQPILRLLLDPFIQKPIQLPLPTKIFAVMVLNRRKCRKENLDYPKSRGINARLMQIHFCAQGHSSVLPAGFHPTISASLARDLFDYCSSFALFYPHEVCWFALCCEIYPRQHAQGKLGVGKD